jgi:hypothetical protein
MKTIRNNNGMSLVEILIASTMAIICIVSVIVSYLTVFNWSEANREETVSTMHLVSMMESIKSTPFSSITADFPNGVNDGPAGNRYTAIVGGYTLTNERITVTYVNPASDPLEVSVALRWKSARGIDRVRYLVTKRTK